MLADWEEHPAVTTLFDQFVDTSCSYFGEVGDIVAVRNSPYFK